MLFRDKLNYFLVVFNQYELGYLTPNLKQILNVFLTKRHGQYLELRKNIINTATIQRKRDYT
jgi:hypothetical protein